MPNSTKPMTNRMAMEPTPTSQIVAFPSALIFGRLSQKYESKTLIPVCIAAYTGIAVFAFFLKSQWQFWVLAVVVGMFQGGVQALSRSHFAKIIPQEKSGEYFGLFDICGKGASFLGTMIVSVGSQLTGSANVGMGSLIVLFIVDSSCCFSFGSYFFKVFGEVAVFAAAQEQHGVLPQCHDLPGQDGVPFCDPE